MTLRRKNIMNEKELVIKAKKGDIICFVCGKKLLYGGADESDEI